MPTPTPGRRAAARWRRTRAPPRAPRSSSSAKVSRTSRSTTPRRRASGRRRGARPGDGLGELGRWPRLAHGENIQSGDLTHRQIHVERVRAANEGEPWDCSTARWRSSPVRATASAGATRWRWPATGPRSWSTTSGAASGARAAARPPTTPSPSSRRPGGTAVAELRQRRRPRAVRRAGPAGGRHLRQARHPGQQRRHRPRLGDLEHAGRRLGRGDGACTCGAPGRRRTSRRSTSATGPSGATTLHGRIINTTSGAGLGGQLRAVGLRHRQGRHRRDDAHRRAGALPLGRHGELHRPGRPHPHHRDHARVGRRVRARRGARGRVEPHGPEEQLADRGVARQRRGRLRHRPGHPRDPRPAHLDGRLVRAQGRSAATASRGTRRSSACSWPPRSSRPATAAWSSGL